tara:strand:+ start:4356 stop:4637 length:282 start_codon:yes stop_codon:yes gene_type:complete
LSKPKLINQLKKKNPDLSKSEINTLVDTFTESIIDALKNGKNVEIRHFGRFYFKILKENFNARNPATNELIYKPERVKVRFKPAKKLKQIINE